MPSIPPGGRTCAQTPLCRWCCGPRPAPRRTAVVRARAGTSAPSNSAALAFRHGGVPRALLMRSAAAPERPQRVACYGSSRRQRLFPPKTDKDPWGARCLSRLPAALCSRSSRTTECARCGLRAAAATRVAPRTRACMPRHSFLGELATFVPAAPKAQPRIIAALRCARRRRQPANAHVPLRMTTARTHFIARLTTAHRAPDAGRAIPASSARPRTACAPAGARTQRAARSRARKARRSGSRRGGDPHLRSPPSRARAPVTAGLLGLSNRT